MDILTDFLLLCECFYGLLVVNKLYGLIPNFAKYLSLFSSCSFYFNVLLSKLFHLKVL